MRPLTAALLALRLMRRGGLDGDQSDYCLLQVQFLGVIFMQIC